MQIPLLADIVTILGVSIAAILLCNSLRVPAIVGFLIAGVLTGPDGLGLVHAVHEVEMLAEIGVVLLLFTIGLEFSLKKLVRIRRSVVLGGSLQVVLTSAATYVISRWGGYGVGTSVLLGFLLSLSSTAIVLKLLQEKAEVDSPHGRITLAILIFQDFAVVMMMLIAPLLAGTGGDSLMSVLEPLGKGILIIVGIVVGARTIIPRLLHRVTKTRSAEIFHLTVLGICLTVAWLTSLAGLSLGLGAFLAGLILSESEYSHDAMGGILPFRDVFTSLFFVSIGMLLDLGFVVRHPVAIISTTLVILILKTTIAGLATFFLGMPLRTIILVGLALSQVGEFSFVLAKIGTSRGLLAPDTYHLFLATSVLTLAVTPFILGAANWIADRVLRLPLPERLKTGLWPARRSAVDAEPLRDHLIIIGYGTNGKNVARAARFAGIRYTILEVNSETVFAERKNGEPIDYGDATHAAVLEHAGIRRARVLVVGISDPAATRRITEVAHRLAPRVHLIVRTRYVQEMEPLFVLGATEVIPEEFETSVEIFARVLRKYLVPRDEIEKFIGEIRSAGYEMFRSWRASSLTTADFRLHLDELDIRKVRVGRGSPLAGRSLAEIDLRKRYGATLLVIRRGMALLPNPDGNSQVLAGDDLYLLGPPEAISVVSALFQNPEPEPQPAPQQLVQPTGASLQ